MGWGLPRDLWLQLWFVAGIPTWHLLGRPQKGSQGDRKRKNPLCQLDSPCLTLAAVSDIPAFLPSPSSAVSLLRMTHSSSTKAQHPSVPLLLTYTLISSSLFSSASLLAREKWCVQCWSCWCSWYSRCGWWWCWETVPGWLADRHQAQMTQAGVRRWSKPWGGTVGTTESVVVCGYLPQLRENIDWKP